MKPLLLSCARALLLAGGLAALLGCNRGESGDPADGDLPRHVRKHSGNHTTTTVSQGQAAGSQESSGGNGGKEAARAEADALFDHPTVLRVEIEIPRAGISALRGTHWERGGERPMAKVTVREGGRVYENVAAHLKGSAGSFRPVDDKPAMTLNFDKLVPGRTFHGLHKISLNNSVQDPSYLCEKISRELFIASGVPTPRAAHALVRLNGRDLGLYVVLEGANRQFLKRFFNNPSGNLYDGGFCRDVNTSLDVNCGEDPNNNSGLKALVRVLRQRKADFASLEKVLDVDRFVSMMGMEMMVCHWDGYTMNRNNWRVFHDLESNRMVFIPHGMDQMFGMGAQFDVGDITRPKHVMGDVAQAVMSTPEGRARYRQRLGELYTNVFKGDAIASRIDELARGVSSAISDSHSPVARSIQQQATSLERRIVRRADALGHELGVPFKPLNFGPDGALNLTDWKRSATRSGQPLLSEGKDPNGKRLLAINAGNAISSASWRARVSLPPGRYQFEGRVRVSGVTTDQGDTRGGAGLRISKGTMPHKLTGTMPWTDFKYPFEVSDDGDVELICELRASNGEAWFDAGSLRLRQLH
jgi:hypothetical protein